MATNMNPIPDIAIPPGRYLGEVLAEKNLTQADLSMRLGKPVQAVNEIIKGKKEITSDTALRLEQVLGIPAQFWLNLDGQYRLVKTRLKEAKSTGKEISLLNCFPVIEMIQKGWIPQSQSAMEKVEALRRYFGVASLEKVRQTEAVAFRKAAKQEASPYALAAWLRKGEIDALGVNTKAFSRDKVQSLISEIPAMTKENPKSSIPRLKEKLAESGVAFVIVPHLKKTFANGAMYWISPDKAVIQMSIRRRYSDIFWFSLLHELGHVLLHGKRETFIEDHPGKVSEKEKEAEAFARKSLIPDVRFREFVEKYRPYFYKDVVQGFARQLSIDPGVVVGRLQHDKIIPPSHLNGLRTQYSLAEKS